MFSIASNASKIALLVLSQMLDSGRLALVDCQMVSQHLMGLGASVIPRNDFVARVKSACDPCEQQAGWPDNPIRCPDLLRE